MGQIIDFKKAQEVGPVAAHPYYQMVKEFGKKFGAPTDHDTCLALIHEEVAEVAEAAAHLIKELIDLQYVITWGIQCGLDQVDATTVDNIQHLEKWRSVVSPHVMDEAFRRVHESNMSKIWDDGKVHYRESDGKVLKPPSYVPPCLDDLV